MVSLEGEWKRLWCNVLRIWVWVIDRNQASLMRVVTEKSKKKNALRGSRIVGSG